MRKIIFTATTLVVMFAILLPGCAPNTDPEETLLPGIPAFSSSEYEEYNRMFSPVESAVFYHDGIRENISPNDPRLIRLLNALCYSYDQGSTAELQGNVKHEKIVEYLESDVPMLEVNLLPEGNDSGASIIKTTPKIVICASSYLLFLDTTHIPWMQDGKMYATQHWPFDEDLYLYYLEQSEEDTEALTMDTFNWGNDKWIDLLSYAGFKSARTR